MLRFPNVFPKDTDFFSNGTLETFFRNRTSIEFIKNEYQITIHWSHNQKNS